MAASIPVPEMRSANGFPRGLQSADYGRKYKLAIAGLARFTARIMKLIIAVMLFASVGQAAVEPIAPLLPSVVVRLSRLMARQRVLRLTAWLSVDSLSV